MKKIIAACTVIALSLLCACGQAIDAETTTSSPTAATATITKPLVQVVPAKAQSFGSPAAGADDFAFRLSRALLQNSGTRSFVSSPYSVWLPLAALVNATDAAYRPALLNALGAAGFGAKELNETATEALRVLTKNTNHNPLRIANAIFVSKNDTLNMAFKRVFAESYNGSAQRIDFASPEAVRIINDWASKNTGGLIRNIADEFDPYCVAAIVNAIYFSGSWETEFDASLTKKDSFHGTGGDTQAHFMLREGDGQAYYEDGRLQAMPLAFSTGGGLLILLPREESANALLSAMTPAYYSQIRNGAAPARGKLLLPRFSIDSGVIDLIDVLAALGIPLVDPGLAALTGLVDGDAVYIDGAVQKAVINVDEKGATAAAATAMTMRKSIATTQPAGEPFRMVCDKPFAFILYGKDGQILFTGAVNQV